MTASDSKLFQNQSTNPWLDLQLTPPYVLDADRAPIEKHNASSKEDNVYDLSLHPEPFVGSLSAPVYLLALNPGRTESDFSWHAKPNCLKILRQAALQSEETVSLYYLSKEFEGSPGFAWWSQKTKMITNEFGVQKTAESLCGIQLYPYHSRKFSKIPAMTSTTDYTAIVIRAAMKESKLIVVLRSWRHWISLVPELSSYYKVATIKNPLNPCLTPGNLGEDFSVLCNEIC